ncbi:sybindin-like family protein [Plectosphaerella plurivora]|uniref:Trafficking protein particle complex subunit n=1 Tax=Plectosphaerella plurivora TaxID=936078 RepID=A0A9P9A6A3_9PEZI|nr:sybindin-like family protein [Plectosphaerella plurivora]
MPVYSFYIFDRHTECVYDKHWLPASIAPSSGTSDRPLSQSSVSTAAPSQPGRPASTALATTPSGPTKDDAKLIYGTVFSLRNMTRKLGGDDDAFICFRTASYKLHYYETPANLRFVMITDTGALSMRNVLHQIYINLWVEYVVKNPLSPVEHKNGAGVRNELFELGLDQFVRGLM